MRKSFIYNKLRTLIISIKGLLGLVFNRNKIFEIIFDLLDLYLITKSNYNKYYNTLISLKFNLLINKEERLIYIEIDIIIE